MYSWPLLVFGVREPIVHESGAAGHRPLDNLVLQRAATASGAIGRPAYECTPAATAVPDGLGTMHGVLYRKEPRALHKAMEDVGRN
jgi:hypothetical protein